MALAVEVASRCNCLKTHVGAILLHDDRIRAVGYNGTVEGYKDCFAGGCPRCKDKTIQRGEQLDRCVCVHAEENALVSAARHGIKVEGSECYVTHEPCLTCTRLLIQAHVAKVVYLVTYEYPDKTDQNTSRKRMRSVSRKHTGITFQDFMSAVPGPRRNSARKLVEVWRERLEKMKVDAENYAVAAGVLKPD